MCVDRKQNIYVTTGSYSVFEYRHGGTGPIFVLTNPAGSANGCAVNPHSGDLALATVPFSVVGVAELAVFKNGRGKPTLYTGATFNRMSFCAYDGNGNLFVDGSTNETNFVFAERPKGASSRQPMTLGQTIGDPGGVQWDGEHVAVGDLANAVVYQFDVNGSTGTEVGKTPLTGSYYVLGFYLDRDGRLINPTYENGKTGYVGIYGYPKGGDPLRSLRDFSAPVSAVVSRSATGKSSAPPNHRA